LYEYEHDEAAALPTTNEKRQKSGASLPCYHEWLGTTVVA
jgi:hypothetical protein